MLLPRQGPQVSGVGTESGLPEHELAGGKQMQRPAHRPSLDEGAVLPERALQRTKLKSFHPCPERQFRTGHYLCMQTTEAAGECQHAACPCAFFEMLSPHAPRSYLRPASFNMTTHYAS